MTWKEKIKPLLDKPYRLIEVYDNGTNGANEVARFGLEDGTEVVIKTMLATKKYHQRRKALTEVVMGLLDHLIGGNTVVPELYAELYTPLPSYFTHWGLEHTERICQIVRAYAPAQPGDEWRGEVYRQCGNLALADRICQQVISSHPDAERISVLDFLTINQDRSARNWVTDHGNRFFAIDNGMAWFHEYPDSDAWQQGCVVDDVILQVEPWQFISGVFTTSWAGQVLSPDLFNRLKEFDEGKLLAGVEQASLDLGFPDGMFQDWRFEGILRRLRWMVDYRRQPSTMEYRAWREGSEYMTPPEIIATGGQIVWDLQWDKCATIAI